MAQSGHWQADREVREFEERFAEYQDAKYGICVTNGTATMEIALRAFGIGAGDEVIVPTCTLISSTEVELPLRDPPNTEEVEAELANPRQAVQEDEKSGKTFNWGQHRRLIWAEEALKGLKGGNVMRSVPGEVQVLRLGDEALFVAVPGELFAEVGLRIKELARGKGPPAFLVAYANAYVGYLPSAQSCREDGDKLRYDWHKFLPYPSTFSEEMEDVLIGTIKELLTFVQEGQG